MKFSTVALTLSAFAMVSAGVAKPKYYKPKPKPELPGLKTVDYEFALGVREKCDPDDIFLVFEIDDGQLEHNGEVVDCKCEKDKRGYKKYIPPPPPVELVEYCTIDKTDCVDTFTLCETVLFDYKKRIGEIVANHQFQFDNPVQPDALYTKGWTIVEKDGYLLLALNGCTDFWECPVDDCGLYKLYDASIDSKCKEIEIIIILIDEECPPEPCPEPCPPEPECPEPCPEPEPVVEPECPEPCPPEPECPEPECPEPCPEPEPVVVPKPKKGKGYKGKY
ncbi:Cell wall mannoprotein PIR1 [Candida viswanathii]|uniref:Cell wall mannoprotein PIR1 n=1 Tax=Candida viswanathii TaxID=5486 RepID=A0A367YP25_9ASCO|nr:Cell wall mannoprotein PIR1 [Candida viswanathii]